MIVQVPLSVFDKKSVNTLLNLLGATSRKIRKDIQTRLKKTFPSTACIQEWSIEGVVIRFLYHTDKKDFNTLEIVLGTNWTRPKFADLVYSCKSHPDIDIEEITATVITLKCGISVVISYDYQRENDRVSSKKVSETV